MIGTVGAMSAFYHDSIDINDPVQRDIAALRMIAKIPAIAAMASQTRLLHSAGQTSREREGIGTRWLSIREA